MHQNFVTLLVNCIIDSVKILEEILHMANFRDNSLPRRNYIVSNLQSSQVEVCFCALRNTPVDLAKVYYLESLVIKFMLTIKFLVDLDIYWNLK